MRNVEVIKVYNLVDSKGNKLRLMLGVLKSRKDDVCIDSRDKGYRWSFIGTNIPMPVRSNTWFNGFPEATMLSWLKANGWYPKACVDMYNGFAEVYELPDAEPTKGNEKPIEAYQVPDNVISRGKSAFNDAIHHLCNNGNKLTAVCLYRYVHPCCLTEAVRAVDAIRFDEQK